MSCSSWCCLSNMSVALLLSMGYFTLAYSSAYSEFSETREMLPLSGVWNCFCESEGEPLEYLQQGGLRKLNGIFKMPIPGSFIDFTAQIDPRNCRSLTWYERNFFIPTNWKNDRKVWLHLDGAAPATQLWINGEHVATTNTSFIPLEFEVTEKLVFDAENLIALAVDCKGVQFPETPTSISLQSIPEMLFIQRVSTSTILTNGTAFIKYKVIADGLLQPNRKCVSIQVLDSDSTAVAGDQICGDLEGVVAIPNCHLWWPICMSSKAGYLYTMVFKLYYKYCDSVVRDVYRQKIGIRTLNWTNDSLMINGRNFFLYGVESNERKPFSPQTDLKDVALLKWLNGNVIATKVAPSREMLDLADELGLLVILGSPKSALSDVIIRFGNHPSVILWSVSQMDGSSKDGDRFLDQEKQLDNTRPFTTVVPLSIGPPPLVNNFDVVSVSLRDFTLGNMCMKCLQTNMEQFQKPIIIMHEDNFLSTKKRIRSLNYDPYPEYNELHRRLDNLEGDISIVGEFFGNLVAYENCTDETLSIADGIFTRNREPTDFADFIRSKFKERRALASRRSPRCRLNKKLRKRI